MSSPDEEWKQADAIVARITPPQFPDQNFSILDFGAVPGGHVDCTDAIKQAIAACHSEGGGHVVVPAGEFFTGAIRLRSNVDLHLEQGAILRFNTDPNVYPPALTRFEGTECYNFSPLIYALNEENIAVTGAGVLDGQAGHGNWWDWKGSPQEVLDRSHLQRMGEKGVSIGERIFGTGHALRPNFIEPYRCRNVLIEGMTIRNSPMWEINPVFCTNVVVRRVQIDSRGPNNDGCNPDSCRDMLIEDCIFDTGDDCISIKSGRDADGRRLATPVENIVIRRCTMKNGHAGVAIGSETSGGCNNVFIEDCTMDGPLLNPALRIKSNALRGGVIENIFVRNMHVGRVTDAVASVEFNYEEGGRGKFLPTLRHMVLEKITGGSVPRVLSIVGLSNSTIDDIRVADCAFGSVQHKDVLKHVTGLSETNVTGR